MVGGVRPYPKIFPLQVGFKKHGKLGAEVSDWFPHLAGCADDLAFVRSMYTTDNDHGAEFQMHTGRHTLDEQQPTIGAWASYGLGTLNENLPSFVFLGRYSDVRVKKDFAADYLGPKYAGVELSLDPKNPQTSARMIPPLGRWKRFDDARAAMMKAELERILAQPGLSRDVTEQASKSLLG